MTFISNELLKEPFLNLHKIKERNKKGKEFEDIIFNILNNEDWNPKKNISNSFQQIDLVANFKGFMILIEAKAIKSALGSPHVEKLFGILSSRPMDTIGIIFTINGVSKTAKSYLERVYSTKTILIFENIDILYILENKVTASDLFMFKMSNIYERGIIHSTAEDFLKYFVSNLNENYRDFEYWKIPYFFNNYFKIPISKRSEILNDLIDNKKYKFEILRFLNEKFELIDKKEKNFLFNIFEKPNTDLAFIFAKYHKQYPIEIIEKYKNKIVEILIDYHNWVVDVDADAALPSDEIAFQYSIIEEALAKMGLPK